MATAQEILKDMIRRSLLLRIGQRAVAIIKVRTSKGKYLEGSTANAGEYSTRPFAMPIGAVRKKDVLKRMLDGQYDDDEIQLFRSSKSQKLWVVIKKGYKWLRRESGKQSNRVDMTWTRKTMRSLGVTDVNPATGEITIDHKDEPSRQISLWQNIMGAGKSKKVRKYLSLTEEELEGLGELI